MTVIDLHHPTMYSFLGGLSFESPPKNLNSTLKTASNYPRIYPHAPLCTHIVA